MQRDRVRQGGRGRRERGSALLLMPAGLLIMILLGAVAFDVSRLYVTRRELVDVATSAASDIAARAIDPAAYRSNGDLRWSQARADAVLAESLDRRALLGRARATVTLLEAPGGPRVRVSLEVDARWLFARGLPGGGRTTVVRADGWALFDAF